MARVNKGSHSFICHPHVYPQVEWDIPVFTPQPQSITALWLVLIPSPVEGRRLSWPERILSGMKTRQQKAKFGERSRVHCKIRQRSRLAEIVTQKAVAADRTVLEATCRAAACRASRATVGLTRSTRRPRTGQLAWSICALRRRWECRSSAAFRQHTTHQLHIGYIRHS